ncbi:RusA family crossover junction endodeoxyribonuclease [Paenibacillus sp. NEAU-GSW1]|uniref:RusA family crossover junction endodeoxyribonuclease n=1 Tax=Paenibacillus sp. NEAU-GSW1 TaxID=2682486 RepID=UPI0012E184AA|nr:RusA family crossover junction endodeoxyribonuclease [Paenibacillus sp. NEAU-GSW1]MUT66031.1 RusA family crossover junction endodeoxyribonuclease [Paenibacillus sp. NEAU-GSW1]
MQLTVNIAPMGCVRMTRRGKWTNAYAQRYLAYKNTIAWAAREKVKKPIESPVTVKLTFYFPIPPSWPKWKKQEAREGRIRPTVKPDIDNIVKGCFDGMNAIVWKDDNQVVEESSSKWYSDHPRIEIEVLEVSA